MPVVTGKVGADAIFKALNRVCIVLKKYQLKLINVVGAAVLAGAITEAEATTITNFIAVAVVTCNAFQALADYTGVIA